MNKLVEQFLKLYEKKDHLIKKLDNLTDEDKETLIKLFQEKPHLENKIDWNNKDLAIEDFDEVLNYISKTEASKSKNKTIPSNFIEGKDYFNITNPEDYFLAYIPLTYQFQKFIQNKGYDGIECEWCIGSNVDRHWEEYSQKSYFIIIISENAKVAVQIKSDNSIIFWNAADIEMEKDGTWEEATNEEDILVGSFETSMEEYIKHSKEILKKYIANNILRYKKNYEETGYAVAENFSFGLERNYSNTHLEIPQTTDTGNLITEIDFNAYLENKNLTSLKVPSNIKIINGSAFSYCENLQAVELSEGLEELGNFAFFNCIKMTNIKLPDSLAVIKMGALSRTNIESISLSKNLEILHTLAFNGCKQLKSVSIPDGLTTIKREAFQDCPSLEVVYTNYTKDNYPKNWDIDNKYFFNAEWKKPSLVESFLKKYC